MTAESQLPSERAFAHRAGLTDSIAALRPDPSLIERIGGTEVVDRVIETLYEHLMKDPLLTPIFRKSFDRAHSKAFFTEWMGGPTRYSDAPEHMRGVWRAHNRFFISKPMAGRWVYYMKNALIKNGVDPAIRKEIVRVLSPLAAAMANGGRTRPENTQLQFGRKSGAIQTLDFWVLEDLRAAIRSGDRDALIRGLDNDPERIGKRGLDGVTLLWQAVEAGDIDLVYLLIERGADVDAPGCLPMCTDFVHEGEMAVAGPLVPTSPLALALRTGRDDIAALLRQHGAVYDWFSAAYVGDIDELARLFAADAELVRAEDPSDDFHRVTALHHAVTGGQRAAAAWLIERGAEVVRHSMWLLAFAALRADVDLVRLLLESGAEARRALVFGPLSTEERPLADILVAAGAEISHHPAHGALLVHACRGQKPGCLERVRALLGYGSDVGSTGLFGITALHLAVRARDPELVDTLLAAGASVDTCDEHGETALFGLQKARAKASAVPVLELLCQHGADMNATSRWRETVLFPLMRQGEADAVAWLLERGIDLSVRNHRGKVARDVLETSRKARAAGIAALF